METVTQILVTIAIMAVPFAVGLAGLLLMTADKRRSEAQIDRMRGIAKRMRDADREI